MSKIFQQHKITLYFNNLYAGYKEALEVYQKWITDNDKIYILWSLEKTLFDLKRKKNFDQNNILFPSINDFNTHNNQAYKNFEHDYKVMKGRLENAAQVFVDYCELDEVKKYYNECNAKEILEIYSKFFEVIFRTNSGKLFIIQSQEKTDSIFNSKLIISKVTNFMNDEKLKMNWDDGKNIIESILLALEGFSSYFNLAKTNDFEFLDSLYEDRKNLREIITMTLRFLPNRILTPIGIGIDLNPYFSNEPLFSIDKKIQTYLKETNFFNNDPSKYSLFIKQSGSFIEGIVLVLGILDLEGKIEKYNDNEPGTDFTDVVFSTNDLLSYGSSKFKGSAPLLVGAISAVDDINDMFNSILDAEAWDVKGDKDKAIGFRLKATGHCVLSAQSIIAIAGIEIGLFSMITGVGIFLLFGVGIYLIYSSSYSKYGDFFRYWYFGDYYNNNINNINLKQLLDNPKEIVNPNRGYYKLYKYTTDNNGIISIPTNQNIPVPDFEFQISYLNGLLSPIEIISYKEYSDINNKYTKFLNIFINQIIARPFEELEISFKIIGKDNDTYKDLIWTEVIFIRTPILPSKYEKFEISGIAIYTLNQPLLNFYGEFTYELSHNYSINVVNLKFFIHSDADYSLLLEKSEFIEVKINVSLRRTPYFPSP